MYLSFYVILLSKPPDNDDHRTNQFLVLAYLLFVPLIKTEKCLSNFLIHKLFRNFILILTRCLTRWNGKHWKNFFFCFVFCYSIAPDLFCTFSIFIGNVVRNLVRYKIVAFMFNSWVFQNFIKFQSDSAIRSVVGCTRSLIKCILHH